MADRKPTCGNCGWAKVVPQNLKTRLCWGAPPTPVALPAPGGIQIKSMRAMVDAGEPGCGMHRFNDLSSLALPAPATDLATADVGDKPN